MQIFFVRHGQAIHNVANETGEAYNPKKIVLTERGKLQSKLTGKYIENVYGNDFDIVYTSPATRCKETCKIITKELRYNGEIIINKKLQELYDGNKMDGLPQEEASRMFNEFGLGKMVKDADKKENFFEKIELYKEFRKKFADTLGGYSVDDADRNLKKFLKKLKKKEYKKVLVISHSSIMSAIQNLVCGIDIYNVFLRTSLFEQSTFDNKNPISRIESGNCSMMIFELVGKKFRLVMPINNIYLKDKIQTGGSNEEFND
jgi:broad specificity phosphatase PhoE